MSFLRRKFDDGARDLFLRHAGLRSFSWRQYAKPVGDGYDATFAADRAVPVINGRRWDADIRPGEFPALWEMQGDAAIFLLNFADDDLATLFGGPAEVTVRRGDGATVAVDVAPFDPEGPR